MVICTQNRFSARIELTQPKGNLQLHDTDAAKGASPAPQAVSDVQEPPSSFTLLEMGCVIKLRSCMAPTVGRFLWFSRNPEPYQRRGQLVLAGTLRVTTELAHVLQEVPSLLFTYALLGQWKRAPQITIIVLEEWTDDFVGRLRCATS